MTTFLALAVGFGFGALSASPLVVRLRANLRAVRRERDEAVKDLGAWVAQWDDVRWCAAVETQNGDTGAGARLVSFLDQQDIEEYRGEVRWMKEKGLLKP